MVGLGQEGSRAIHSALKFHVWDKQMKDGIDGAHPLKPDIAGVLGEETPDTLFWSPPVEGESEMVIPVEVKEVWSTLVLQAGTYARCMFSASPLRQFVLVIGYDHQKRLLRFLVYHRAGLTASQPLELTSVEGQKHFVLVLFSILTWQTRANAGFPAWCNEAQLYLPRSDAAVDIVRILHNSSCVRGRAPRVYYVHVPAASGSKPTEDLTPDTQTKGLRRSLRIQHKSDSQRSKKSGIDGKRSSQQSNRVAELQGKKSSQGSGRNDQRRSDPSKGASKNSQVKVPRTDNERVLSIVISRNRALGYELLKVEQEIVWAPPNQLRLDTGDFAAVKLSWIPGRGLNYVLIEPRLLRDCGGMFGVPKHFYSFRAHHQNGCPTTNHLLLPSPSENPDDFRWNLFRELPENPEYRSLLGHVIAFAGHSLVSAKDLPSLIRAVLHAHLGYYNMCQKNYQHRDLSIGNVLMVDEPVKSKPFDIPDPKNQVQEEILRVCKELKIDDQCTGFVIDGDMAVDWNTYFNEEHVGTKSGTAEFMSSKLLDPRQKNYMHSPLDDYYSFFFVTQWACVFHASSPQDPSTYPELLEGLRERIAGDANMRDAATLTITGKGALEPEDYGAFLGQAQPFLREWWHECLQELEPKWKKMTVSQGNNIDSFRAIAELGLLSFLKIARKYVS
ncbi:hypothetical protein GYMLUDRAFT_207582 [Collybiopsis luxurians FD-317 M1]|uniref:Unplaced genomic scaffold GYMLUscaffold_84, whole genome shotgun sequence n=1 Tax=Collybiopsis luxurians FD-317 M1 TaxID=944289 RepID=A0A0D0C5S3_9AGAR|nr:hypothetical protein GYMLUDRAFT_207582 [Collybiopsis luxurians FD-317 M1]